MERFAKIIILALTEVLLIGSAILHSIIKPINWADITMNFLAIILVLCIIITNYFEHLKENRLGLKSEYLEHENDRLTHINQALVTINRIQNAQLETTKLQHAENRSYHQLTPPTEFGQGEAY